MKILVARVAEKHRAEAQAEIDSTRKSAVGTGDRVFGLFIVGGGEQSSFVNLFSRRFRHFHVSVISDSGFCRLIGFCAYCLGF